MQREEEEGRCLCKTHISLFSFLPSSYGQLLLQPLCIPFPVKQLTDYHYDNCQHSSRLPAAKSVRWSCATAPHNDLEAFLHHRQHHSTHSVQGLYCRFYSIFYNLHPGASTEKHVCSYSIPRQRPRPTSTLTIFQLGILVPPATCARQQSDKL